MQRLRLVTTRGHLARIAICAIACFALVPLSLAQETAQETPAPAGTLDRIREAGRLRLGYRADARPLSYQDESGAPAGYSVALCQKIAEATKAELGLGDLPVEWVPVTVESRFRAVQQGEIDLLCGAETATLGRRQEVAFSIPVFPGGIGALLRTDAPARLREVLSGRKPAYQPTWRASVVQLLQTQTFSAVGGTTAETWLAGKLDDFQVSAEVAPVDGYETGIQQLLDRGSSAFFGDRAILQDAALRNPRAKDLVVLDRYFTSEPLALVLARGDEDFRLVVDRTLSGLYGSGEIGDLYAKWFGEPDDNALTFFRWNTLPE